MNFNESNYTAEQIAAAKALLDSLAPKRPLERWVVVDRDGDPITFANHADAQEEIRKGPYNPYTLHHLREVLP